MGWGMAMDLFIVRQGWDILGHPLICSLFPKLQIYGLLFPPEFYLSEEFSEVKTNLLDGLQEEFEWPRGVYILHQQPSVPSVPRACSWALCQYLICCLAGCAGSLWLLDVTKDVFQDRVVADKQCDGPMRSACRVARRYFSAVSFLNLVRN